MPVGQHRQQFLHTFRRFLLIGMAPRCQIRIATDPKKDLQSRQVHSLFAHITSHLVRLLPRQTWCWFIWIGFWSTSFSATWSHSHVLPSTKELLIVPYFFHGKETLLELIQGWEEKGQCLFKKQSGPDNQTEEELIFIAARKWRLDSWPPTCRHKTHLWGIFLLPRLERGTTSISSCAPLWHYTCRWWLHIFLVLLLCQK